MKFFSLMLGTGLALSLFGVGCRSASVPLLTPDSNLPTSAPAPAPVPAATTLPEGTYKTKLGFTDRLRNVKLVTAQGNKISSPLLITGEARLWYFEASFPIQIVNAAGLAIVNGYADADGNWMTEEWVPFTAELQFPTQLDGSEGTLIFKADNPSGDASRDDSVELSVTF